MHDDSCTTGSAADVPAPPLPQFRGQPLVRHESVLQPLILTLQELQHRPFPLSWARAGLKTQHTRTQTLKRGHRTLPAASRVAASAVRTAAAASSANPDQLQSPEPN